VTKSTSGRFNLSLVLSVGIFHKYELKLNSVNNF
jgi:hypothetical protein